MKTFLPTNLIEKSNFYCQRIISLDHRQSKERTGNARLKRYDADATSVIRAST